MSLRCMFYPIAKDQDPNIGVKGKQKLFFWIFNNTICLAPEWI